MNLLDKKIAQKNGLSGKAKPVWLLEYYYKPLFKADEQPEKNVLAKMFSKDDSKQTANVLDEQELKSQYYFYYDDPNETTEERIAIANKITLENIYVNEWKERLVNTPEKEIPVNYQGKVYTLIGFESVNVREVYVKKPQYVYKKKYPVVK